MCYYTLKNYEILVPPYPLEFDDWSREKAADYLAWFVLHVPERAAYVYHAATGNSLPDGAIPPECLIDIWSWFLKHAKIEPVPKQEIEYQRQKFGYFGEDFISKTRFNVRTEYLIRDIAMLMSAVFTTNYPNLYWDFASKPKKYIFINQPVLKGFVNTRYGKPFADVFQPVHMVHVQAVKFKERKSCITDLFDLFCLWEQDIPQTE